MTKPLIFKAKDGWRFRIVARNGEILAQSEAYVRRADCVHAHKLLASLGRWFPTSYNPCADGEYFVVVRDGKKVEGSIGHYSMETQEWSSDISTLFEYGGNITHWAPMDLPPK